jgi:hypothetical protein
MVNIFRYCLSDVFDLASLLAFHLACSSFVNICPLSRFVQIVYAAYKIKRKGKTKRLVRNMNSPYSVCHKYRDETNQASYCNQPRGCSSTLQWDVEIQKRSEP